MASKNPEALSQLEEADDQDDQVEIRHSARYSLHNSVSTENPSSQDSKAKGPIIPKEKADDNEL